MTAIVDMARHGKGAALERKLMVGDRLSGQIVPPLISYHYHGRHIALQTLFGSEKMMLQLRGCVSLLFVLFYGRFKNRLSCLFDIHLHFASMDE